GFTPRYAAALAPTALLENNAAGLAAANLEPDPDGVVRRAAIALRLGDGLIPGMAAEATRLLADRDDIVVTSNERDPLSFFSGIGIASLQTATAQVPTGKDGRAWLRYDTQLRQLDPDALAAVPLKDAVVVVGLAGQVARTPLGPASTA